MGGCLSCPCFWPQTQQLFSQTEGFGTAASFTSHPKELGRGTFWLGHQVSSLSARETRALVRQVRRQHKAGEASKDWHAAGKDPKRQALPFPSASFPRPWPQGGLLCNSGQGWTLAGVLVGGGSLVQMSLLPSWLSRVRGAGRRLQAWVAYPPPPAGVLVTLLARAQQPSPCPGYSLEVPTSPTM